MGAFDRGVTVGVVTDGHLADARLALPAGSVERADQVGGRFHGDQRVRDMCGQLAGPGAGGGQRDSRRRVGQVPQLRRVDAEVASDVVDVVAAEQGPDDVYSLAEHLVMEVHRRPAACDHVFVEVLTGAEHRPGVG